MREYLVINILDALYWNPFSTFLTLAVEDLRPL
jgi:hypothetical protein